MKKYILSVLFAALTASQSFAVNTQFITGQMPINFNLVQTNGSTIYIWVTLTCNGSTTAFDSLSRLQWHGYFYRNGVAAMSGQAFYVDVVIPAGYTGSGVNESRSQAYSFTNSSGSTITDAYQATFSNGHGNFTAGYPIASITIYDDSEPTSALTAAVAALTTAYQAADTALQTALEAQINAVNTALDARITSLETDLATAQGNITTLQTDLAAAQASLATTQSDVGVLSIDLADTKTEVATMKTILTNSSGQLTTTQNELASLKASQAALNTTVTEMQTKQTSMQSDLSGYQKKQSPLMQYGVPVAAGAASALLLQTMKGTTLFVPEQAEGARPGYGE